MATRRDLHVSNHHASIFTISISRRRVLSTTVVEILNVPITFDLHHFNLSAPSSSHDSRGDSQCTDPSLHHRSDPEELDSGLDLGQCNFWYELPQAHVNSLPARSTQHCRLARHKNGRHAACRTAVIVQAGVFGTARHVRRLKARKKCHSREQLSEST